jgi:putative endonuclease
VEPSVRVRVPLDTHAERGFGPLSGPPMPLVLMYYVYILHSKKDGDLYIGSTPDLKVRLKRHQSGYVKATKYRLPVSLIYSEIYTSSVDAKRREIFLKGGKGRGELKIQLKDTFNKIDYKHR